MPPQFFKEHFCQLIKSYFLLVLIQSLAGLTNLTGIICSLSIFKAKLIRALGLY